MGDSGDIYNTSDPIIVKNSAEPIIAVKYFMQTRATYAPPNLELDMSAQAACWEGE